MGKSSKPLTIMVDSSLYTSHREMWDTLEGQGFTILIENNDHPDPVDLYLAPYAMRMTPDMLAQLPSAFELAIKGARALRYAPTAKDTTAWKGGKKKNAKAKGTHRRKNSKVTVEVTDTGEPSVETEDTGTGGATVSTASETTNHEGASQVG